jgi:hypothetical protein
LDADARAWSVWYYGVYSAASAMTAAMDGSFQDNHAETAKKWHERFPASAEYLSGTSSWEQWNIQERIRETHAFKALKVSGFRTKAAREMRDAGYAKRALLFCIRQ